jgi:hypothetical protein
MLNGLHAARSAAADEHGGVLAIVAVSMPVLLVFAILVIDVGNWFVHSRHLQTQADAGALAGGDLFRGCYVADQTAANAAINSEARKYAGDAAVVGRHNPQVGVRSGEGVVILLNSKTYDRGGPSADDTLVGQPCATKMIDVKISDEDLPWFLRAARVSAINARARVEARKISQIVGSLPIAVPDVEPKVASVRFYEEGTGTTLGTAALTGPTIVNGLAQFAMASGATVPITVTAGHDIGVQVNLGGQTSTTCGDAYVACWGSAPPSLSLIRAYSTSGSGAQPANAPIPRAVWPIAGACSGAPSVYAGANMFYGGTRFATCSVGIGATVDFGTGAVDPTRPKSAGGVKAVASASVAGCSPASVPLTWAAGVWSTSAFAFGCPAQAGPLAVSLHLEEQDGTNDISRTGACTTTGGNQCKWNFANIQRVFSAQRSLSGPIKLIGISEPGVSTTGSPLALAPGAHNLRVIVGTQYLKAADPADMSGDETIGLRVADPSGSQNQAFDCDPGVTFRLEIENGCKTPYGPNPNTPGCPETTPPTPLDCMPIQPGDAVGQLEGGMDSRFGVGGGCTINHWPNPPVGDPREIPVIITDFNAFQGQGATVNQQVPVRRFGYFYITGWSRSNCSTNEPYPWSSNRQDERGDIWGHFVFHVDSINNGGAGQDPCTLNADPTIFDPCVAVMTR